MEVSPIPITFPKTTSCITGHGDPIEVPKIIQDEQADYEAELVVVIGKDAKNVKEEDAFDYVVGYTAGNDLSGRLVQQRTATCFTCNHHPKMEY